MAGNSQDLRKELKEFICVTKHLLDSKVLEDDAENQALDAFAQRVWNLHHFSLELLSEMSADEEKKYNARIIKDLTEAPLYHQANKDTCSLVNAADKLKKEQEYSALKTIMANFIKDQIAAEVLLDNLSVIYKELAA